jgi:repressor LexA
MPRFTPRNDNGLTQKQREVLDYILQHHRTRKIAPTSREIQHQFGFASQSAAVSHVNAIIRRGCGLISKNATGRLVIHEETVPWEDVKTIIESIVQGRFIDPTSPLISSLFTKHPHLKTPP